MRQTYFPLVIATKERFQKENSITFRCSCWSWRNCFSSWFWRFFIVSGKSLKEENKENIYKYLCFAHLHSSSLNNMEIFLLLASFLVILLVNNFSWAFQLFTAFCFPFWIILKEQWSMSELNSLLVAIFLWPSFCITLWRHVSASLSIQFTLRKI